MKKDDYFYFANVINFFKFQAFETVCYFCFYYNLGWNAPTKIKIIREITFLLTTNLLHILMQKLLKSMINSINPRYIQYFDQFLQWLR